MSWITDHLNDIIGAATGAYDVYNTQNTAGNIGDLLRSREDRNYAESKKYYDATSSYLDQLNAARAANASAANAAAASRAAAAQATEAARQRAAKKGTNIQVKGLRVANDLFAPFVAAGQQVLPNMVNTYNSGLGGLNLLAQYLQRPGLGSRLDQTIPASQTSVPLPSWLKDKLHAK